jgi:hypothetical protein
MWLSNQQLVLAGTDVSKELVFVRLVSSLVRPEARVAWQRVARSTTARR